MGCEPIIDGKPASQAAIDALDWKNSVRVATTAVLPANTFANNRLTGTANGPFAAVDGITLVVNEDILVKNEVAGADNGIYVLIQLGIAGGGGEPYILQRRADANTSAEVTSGMTVPVEEGTINDNTAWTLTTAQPITLNTTALVFQNIISLLQDLNSVLGVGNTTGGLDIQVTAGDQILMEGAASADAPAGSESLIIGDGALGNNFGLSIFTGTDAVGIVNMTDVSGAVRGTWSYEHANVRHVWAVEASDEMFLTAVALSPAADAGNSIGTDALRWLEGFIDQLLVAGSVAADASALADDLIIGDGSAASFGMTFFAGAGQTVRWVIADSAGGADMNLRWTLPSLLTMRLDNVDRTFWSTTTYEPVAARNIDLGSTTTGWQDLHLSRAALIAGAVQADGPAGAIDLVIGDGSAAAGLTIFTTTTTEGTIVFTDGAGVEQASIVYDHNAPQFAWTVETSLEMLLTTVALSPGADAGSSLGTDPLRWLEGFIDQLLVGGAVTGDAPAAENDLVIGDGVGDRGLTIFSAAASSSAITFADTAATVDGRIRYSHTASAYFFAVSGTEELTLNASSLFPEIDNGLGLGSSTKHWLEVFAGRQIYGVEPTGATVTVTTNGRIIADATAGNVDVDLPDAAVGLDYQLIVLDATNGVDVTPTASDTINGGVAGTALTLSVAGRYFITAMDAVDWAVHGPLAEAT